MRFIAQVLFLSLLSVPYCEKAHDTTIPTFQHTITFRGTHPISVVSDTNYNTPPNPVHNNCVVVYQINYLQPWLWAVSRTCSRRTLPINWQNQKTICEYILASQTIQFLRLTKFLHKICSGFLFTVLPATTTEHFFDYAGEYFQ